MAKHKYQKALARLLREIIKYAKSLTRQFVRWFTRSFFVTNRHRRGQAGFVLPTVAFMLMVVALVVTAILFRTFSRSTQITREYNQVAITNSASPALQRAKSKLEYLLSGKDMRVPTGIPSEEQLEELLFEDEYYKLPDEERQSINIGDAATPANVWTFKTDTNGNNKTDDPQDLTTIYAIVSRAERTVGGKTYTINPANTTQGVQYLGNSQKEEQQKADYFITRNGPLSAIAGSTDPECQVAGGATIPGWFDRGTANVYKAFQVYAVTVPNALIDGKSAATASLATLQYQQDRVFSRGNKWGAWFRYDWEVYPGDPFDWNGAVHSEGSIFYHGGTQGGNGFPAGVRSRLISSPKSCFFNQAENSGIDARGQIVNGRIRENVFSTTTTASMDGFPDYNSITVSQQTDSVTPGGGARPTDIATDPLTMHTRGESKPRRLEGPGTWTKDAAWDNSPLAKQRATIAKKSCAPYVDDTYRADNIYGPKPSYSKETLDEETEQCIADRTGAMGETITANPPEQNLIGDNPPVPSPEDVGLDGYWERRARNEGLRVIVGQRLELGNPFGWNVDLDDSDNDRNVINDTAGTSIPADRALYAPENGAAGYNAGLGETRRNEGKQYVTLRDNLAAVQSTAVYHYTTTDKGYFPYAFIATTAHPGTVNSRDQSTSFTRIPAFNTKPVATGGSNLFGPQFGDGNNEILSNFFLGEGTNGWEFNVVPGAVPVTPQTEAAFAGLINNSNSALRKALRNLAYFAGDPDGAFPPKQDAPGTNAVIHPYPLLRMWGDFSNLRRTIGTVEAGTQYANLSIADKSNLHTAAGTLGMLAYNISYLQDFDYANNNNQTLLTNLDNSLQDLGTTGNGKVDINSDAGASGADTYTTGSSKTGTIDVTLSSGTAIPKVPFNWQAPAPPPTTPEAFIAALKKTDTAANRPTRPQDLAKLLHLKEQVERDRKYGFREKAFSYTLQNNLTYAGWNYATNDVISLGCDISSTSGNNYFGAVAANGTPTPAQEARAVRLALSLCSSQPKFPSLYYVFPKYNHTHQGNAAPGVAPASLLTLYPAATHAATDYLQPGNAAIVANAPPTEPYVTDPYVITNAVNGAPNFQYQVLGDTNNNGVEDATENGIAQIALMPKDNPTSLITAPATVVNGIFDRRTDLTITTRKPVPFQDKGIFDGREMMGVRVLDIDLDMLRRNGISGDAWLPDSGLVYAFREDAVREDTIARPRFVNWGNSGAGYRGAWNNSIGDPQEVNIMDVFGTGAAPGTTPADPPVCYIGADTPLTDPNNPNYDPCTDPTGNQRGISPKPVDYYADPDRRPHGFRLRNGADLTRTIFGMPSETDLKAKNRRGMSFISDNPVYIQDNFNLHSNNGTSNNIEEFTEALTATNFYTRQNKNTAFAKVSQDRWRPSEVIADAVNILSRNFCDGTVESGILDTNTVGGCNNSIRSSYQNNHFQANPPNFSVANGGWICENPFDPKTSGSGRCDGPIKIFRNGEVRYYNTLAPAAGLTPVNITTYNNYRQFNSAQRQLTTASQTWVNAILVSGVVPSRALQGNGGFTSFPRLNEYWGNVTLNLSGSMIQLSFSNYATAPFDQDAWEPNLRPSSGEFINYYIETPGGSRRAPTRRWGYDVGLQFQPAAPVARRMVAGEPTRDEFYRQPPADDPYICKLRSALNYPCQ